MMRRKIGVVLQDKRLLEHLNAFDNVALPLRLAGRKPNDYVGDVTELLGWVGLGDRMEAYPLALSGGEQQRLAIARAVVNRPEILLADEPTGDVDHEMALRILRLFVELNRLGATVLIASHDDALVNSSGRAILHLEAGRLELDPPGGPHERRRPRRAAPPPGAPAAERGRPRRRPGLRGGDALLPGLPGHGGRPRRRRGRRTAGASS